MIQLFALAQFAILIAILVTLIKVIRVKSQPRIKMLLVALYTASAFLYLNDSVAMDIADRHGLDGAEPMIFGTWQIPVQGVLLVAILGLQIYFLSRSRKQKKTTKESK
jgi:uncharacterized protein with PQ loop repeat